MAIGGEVLAHATVKVDADTSDMGPQIKRSMAKSFQKGDAEKLGSDWSKSFYKGVHREIKSGSDDAGKEWGDGFFRNLKAQFKNTRMEVDVDVDTKAMGAKIHKFADQMKMDVDADVDLKTMGAKIHKFASNLDMKVKADVDLSTMGAKIHAFTNTLPGIMGRAFGKGSRNNFLNIIGSMVEGVGEFAQGTVKAFSAVGKAVMEIPDVFKSVQNAMKGMFDQAEGGAGIFTKLGGSIGEGLGSLSKMGGPLAMVITGLMTVVAVAGGAVFAFFALGEAVAVVVSALSMLAAGAVAVASAVGVGLIGAIGALLPILGAGVAMIGVLITGFSNLSKEQKKIIAPLKTMFDTLQTKVQGALFKDLSKQVKDLGLLIKNFLQPMLVGVAGAVSQAFTKMLATLNSSEFKPFLDALSTSFTAIAKSLGDVFANLLPGIIAFFKPILPYAEQLAASIAKVAETFKDWATSAGGQTAIGEFFAKAWAAAQQLWEIIKNVGEALGTVFGAGLEGGQGFLTWLGEATGKLSAFLKSPEGQQQLKQWFQDAKTFGEQLFTAIGKVVEAFGRLDTAGNREFATQIIAGIGGIMEVVGKLGPAFEATGRALGTMALIASKGFSYLLTIISGVAGIMKGFFDILGKVPAFDWARDIADDLGKVSGSAADASKKLDEMPDEINMMFKVDDTDLQDAQMELQELTSVQQPDVMTKFTGETSSLTTAATTAMSAAKGIPPEVLTTFDGDMGPISAAATGADTAIESVHPDWLTTFLGDKNPVAGIATQATGAINAVPDENNTVFAGVNSQLTGTATAATGAINAVPDDNTTSFIGKDTSLGKAVGAANSAVDTVPDSHTTYLDGDTSGLMGKIKSARAAVSGLLSQISGAMSNADLGGASGLTAGWASGGLTRGPQFRLIGEDGPEAVVPLRRSLGRVDPSVRDLSAFAQGLIPSGKNITIAPGAIQVTVPNTDPELAASALLDRFTILVN